MKTNLYLTLPLMFCASLISCDKGERIAEKNNTDIYEEIFARASDGYSMANTWNTAKVFSIDITPASDGIVKIYAPCKDVYRLVAHYSKAAGPFTANFDAPASSENFVVAIAGTLYSVQPGGRVTPDSLPVSDVKVSDEPFQWILAVENIFDAENKSERAKDQIDLDFNDVLIGIRSVVTDDYVSLDLVPLACGDDQPFYIHIKTDDDDRLLWQSKSDMSDDCEFHQWFGVKDYTKGVNTGANASGQVYQSSIFTIESIASVTSGCHLEMPPYWTLSNYSYQSHDYRGNIIDVWGLYITVGTYKGCDFVKNNSDYGLICSKGNGYAPQMLLFPDTGVDGKWRWPCEGNSLIYCYPLFTEWAMDPEHQLRMLWHEWSVTPGSTRVRY